MSCTEDRTLSSFSKRWTAGKMVWNTALIGALLAMPCVGVPAQTAPSSATQGQAASPGVPFSADKLANLLPATVFFAGRTAPIQLRNAGAVQFADGTMVWIALVDSSGYATSVQQRYQFYLVAEGPVRFGNVTLSAGAYGGGFLDGHFVLMDLGNHTIGEGPTQMDAGMRRPRPLQLLPEQPDAVKLALGRQWITIEHNGSR